MQLKIDGKPRYRTRTLQQGKHSAVWKLGSRGPLTRSSSRLPYPSAELRGTQVPVVELEGSTKEMYERQRQSSP